VSQNINYKHHVTANGKELKQVQDSYA